MLHFYTKRSVDFKKKKKKKETKSQLRKVTADNNSTIKCCKALQLYKFVLNIALNKLDLGVCVCACVFICTEYIQ